MLALIDRSGSWSRSSSAKRKSRLQGLECRENDCRDAHAAYQIGVRGVRRSQRSPSGCHPTSCNDVYRPSVRSDWRSCGRAKTSEATRAAAKSATQQAKSHDVKAPSLVTQQRSVCLFAALTAFSHIIARRLQLQARQPFHPTTLALRTAHTDTRPVRDWQARGWSAAVL